MDVPVRPGPQEAKARSDMFEEQPSGPRRTETRVGTSRLCAHRAPPARHQNPVKVRVCSNIAGFY